MKKITLLAVALLAISFTSCKKDRTCECTSTYTSSSGTVTTSTAKTVLKDGKGSDAKSLCQKKTTVNVGNSGNTSTNVQDCKIK